MTENHAGARSPCKNLDSVRQSTISKIVFCLFSTMAARTGAVVDLNIPGVGWIVVGAVLYWLLCSSRSGSTDQSIASR